MKEDLVTLNERGLTPTVILGGAALNRRYVEQDLRKLYRGELHYGEDAFDGLRIMDSLVARKKLSSVGSTALKGVMAGSGQRAPERPAATLDSIDAATHQPAPGCCAVHDAIAALAAIKRSPTLTKSLDLPAPPFLGSRVRTDFDMRDIFPYINELTLFSTQWQFRKGGVRPSEHARQIAEVARPALARLKKFCLDENLLHPAATYGFFPAASDGNNLTIYEDDRRTPKHTFTFPRQDFGDYLCLSDYTEPLDGGKAVDHVAFMAVTMGHEISKRCKELYEANRYQEYLFLHGLGVESAEALAEYFHQQVRREWGIADQDATDIRKLFKTHYRGSRYSFGFPACPNLGDQAGLFTLIEPHRIGVTLTEHFMLEPEQSTTAIIFHHPDAKYFNVRRAE